MSFIAPKPGIGSVVTNIRLAKGVLPRIDRVLHGGELRSDFIRAAIDAELQRREREAEKAQRP
jgi:metal-responsive CopG/Arc/MetJ family transcriptional regulator